MKQRIASGGRWLQLVNIAAFIAVIVVNALANLVPIGGNTTQEIAAMYPNLFQPAGFTFAIWGLIYFALGLFVLYQADLLPGVQGGSELVQDVGWLFVLSSIANIAWLFAWHNNRILLSLAVMIVLLVSLILIYRRLREREPMGSGEVLFARIPFSLYLGWISVATIANIAIALVSVNWGGFGLPEQFWTVAVILIALVLAVWFLAVERDVWYALVIAWANVGILVRHLTELQGEYPIVIAANILSLIVLIGGIAVSAMRQLREA